MRLLVPLDNRGGGGIARVASGLVRALAEQLEPSDILLIQGTLAGPPRCRNLRFRPAPELARNGARRALQQQLSLRTSARMVDLVHMTDYRAPLLGSTPFVLSVHDVTFIDHPEWYPRSVATYKRGMLTASLARRPRGIVCNSQFTRDRLLAHHPSVERRSLVRVIPPGLEPPPADLPPPVGGRTDQGGYFLTVSAIEPRKNHLGLLAAFQRARRLGLSLTWKVVGAPQYDSADILDELRSAPGVQIVGRVSESELEALYHGATFFALSSFEEGFGYPPLEAMARGVPVLCSTGSSLDEMSRGGAIQLAPGDTDAWVEGLLRLERDERLRAELVAAGRQQAERFDWRAAARAHVGLFREILGG